MKEILQFQDHTHFRLRSIIDYLEQKEISPENIAMFCMGYFGAYLHQKVGQKKAAQLLNELQITVNQDLRNLSKPSVYH